jgi:hypothetical protein
VGSGRGVGLERYGDNSRADEQRKHTDGDAKGSAHPTIMTRSPPSGAETVEKVSATS